MLTVHDNTIQFSTKSSERLIITKAYLRLAFPSVGLKFGWERPIRNTSHLDTQSTRHK